MRSKPNTDVMKLKGYHSIIIFALIVMSAVFSSVSSYRRAQYAIAKDMNKALALTLKEYPHSYITPDTIQSYRSHLSIDLLKQNSNLCYVVKEDKKYHIESYANCSMLDILGMSNQRASLSLYALAMLWGLGCLYYNRRKRTARLTGLVSTYGSLAYQTEDDYFFNQESNQTIKFTPMQHQLMQLFMKADRHQLSKQEICDALWPKKPDASETLYTLIRRIKPIIEKGCNLRIESERGKAYRLTES